MLARFVSALATVRTSPTETAYSYASDRYDRALSTLPIA